MKTKRWRRGISILLSCTLIGSLMPAVVFAEETEPVSAKAILPGTAGIDSPTQVLVDEGAYYEPNDYIYYGSFEGFPIKWRVLDAQKANDRETDGMFLLSEQMVEHEVNYGYFGADGEWQDSEAQYWCKKFAEDSSNFSAAEQAAMLGVEKTEEDQTQFYLDWYGSRLTADDKMFFLSAGELADYVGNYDGAPGHQTTLLEDNSNGRYWLRSVFSKAQEQEDLAEDSPYKDGIYKGHHETKLVVKVTIQNGQIVSIEQTNTHTPAKFEKAWEAVYPQILEKQSVEVDGVSGATLSSDSIKTAVGRALESARKDVQTEPSKTKDETGVVVETVGPYHFWVALSYNARTACNLNLDSVLFTSPAEDIKTAEIGSFSEIGGYDGNEWKMTLKDSDRNDFQAEAASEREQAAALGYTDWKVKVNYSNAKAGENEYVSAMLCDENGEYLYYGSLANNSAEGTAEITIPENLPLGSYILNVFSEQKNGSKSSDYASGFASIHLEVKEEIEPEPTQEPTPTDTPETTPPAKPTEAPPAKPTAKPTETPTAKPVTVGKVNGLKLSSNANSVKLTWKKASNAEGYKVERYNASKKKYAVIATVKGTSYTNKKLSAASAYQYRVRGYVTKDKKTTYGKYSSAGKILTAPAAPASVKIKRNGAKTNKAKAVLSFKQSTRATYYTIYKYNKKTKKYVTAFRVKGKTLYSYNAKTKKYKKVNNVKVKNKAVTCTLTNLTLKADKTQKYIVRAVAEKKGYPAKTGAASKAVTLK